MGHKTVVWVGTAVAAPCRMSIGLAGSVVPDPAEAGTEAGKPDLGSAWQGSFAAFCHSMKALQPSPIASSSFS